MKFLRIAALLTLALCLFVVAAGADANVVDQTFSWYDAELNPATGTLMVKPTRDDGYYLTDCNGNRLSNVAYTDKSYNGSFYRVAVVKDETNRYGVIDATGKQLVPMQYGDIKFIGEKWLAAAVLEPATEENYDYTTYGSTKQFFLVKQWDLYFMGQKVGSVDRVSYDYATEHGSYLWIRSKSGAYTAYDPQFNARAVESSSEFSMNYKTKTVTHEATGINAFTPGCPLTDADVETNIYKIDGVYYDLQGNAMFADNFYSVYSFYGDFAKTRTKAGAYGLIDQNGNQVLAEEYEDIDLANSTIGYFPCGYQLVKKDGKIGIACLADGTVWMSIYPSGAKYRNYGPFVFITDLDGTNIVMSGAVGELNSHYTDIRSSYQSTAPYFVAQNANKEVGVIGLMGEELLPFTADHTYMYDFDPTYDGSVLLVRDDDYDYKTGYRTYHVYLIDYELPSAPAVDEPAPFEPVAPSIPAADGSWACPTCGSVNTGKFCPECGTARP